MSLSRSLAVSAVFASRKLGNQRSDDAFWTRLDDHHPTTSPSVPDDAERRCDVLQPATIRRGVRSGRTATALYGAGDCQDQRQTQCRLVLPPSALFEDSSANEFHTMRVRRSNDLSPTNWSSRLLRADSSPMVDDAFLAQTHQKNLKVGSNYSRCSSGGRA